MSVPVPSCGSRPCVSLGAKVAGASCGPNAEAVQVTLSKGRSTRCIDLTAQRCAHWFISSVRTSKTLRPLEQTSAAATSAGFPGCDEKNHRSQYTTGRRCLQHRPGLPTYPIGGSLLIGIAWDMRNGLVVQHGSLDLHAEAMTYRGAQRGY